MASINRFNVVTKIGTDGKIRSQNAKGYVKKKRYNWKMLESGKSMQYLIQYKSQQTYNEQHT